MKVELIGAHMPHEMCPHVIAEYKEGEIWGVNFERTANVGAAVCIGKHHEARQRNPHKVNTNLEAAVDSGHLSVIEHITMSFLVEDISRACSHQLVRHRIASYSQLSQRYTVIDTNEDWYVRPKSIQKRSYYNINYSGLMKTIADYYNEMIDNGIPAEDARMVLPNACFTNILITMNGRAFIEACSKRICNKAQWEIRELFTKMREAIKKYYPTVYELSGPDCSKQSGCKETNSCGKTEYGKKL